MASDLYDMDETIAVSVVIPVYNTEKYLDQCLSSLRVQTLQEAEFLCVDDGSTDCSLEILQRHASEDSRIKILAGTHQTAGAARNRAMEMARGEYLMFLDSDDFFEANLLELMYAKAKAEDLDMAVCGVSVYEEATGRSVPAPRQIPPELWGRMKGKVFCPRTAMPDKLFQLIAGTPWNKIWRRRFIEKHVLRYQPIENSNDTYFTYASFLLADRVALVDAVLVHWRLRSHSLTRAYHKHPLCFLDALESLADLLQRFPDERLMSSFRFVSVELCVWRCALTPPRVRPLVKDAITRRLEPKLALNAFVSDNMAHPSPSLQRDQRAFLISYSQIFLPERTYVLSLGLNRRQAWRTLRRLSKHLPSFTNAVVFVSDLPPGLETALQAQESGQVCVLFIRRDDREKLAEAMALLPDFVAHELIIPGLFSTRRYVRDEGLSLPLDQLKPMSFVTQLCMPYLLR